MSVLAGRTKQGRSNSSALVPGSCEAFVAVAAHGPALNEWPAASRSKRFGQTLLVLHVHVLVLVPVVGKTYPPFSIPLKSCSSQPSNLLPPVHHLLRFYLQKAMGRPLYSSVRQPAVRVQPEHQYPSYEKWSYANAFDPDAEEFFENERCRLRGVHRSRGQQIQLPSSASLPATVIEPRTSLEP
ncbi:hypothetical protein NUW54_g6715 [Trametes sanguinea]|uniref:Uncharacterized protein n=1 Tax=Trametes sanguinea TaxID=158606 RepID=A0ACC1PRI7_9APHY|nr:hypothetical protein NUW54_g6715 [Trametes sanguinea]